jgi:hypothetical protein
MSSVYGVGQDGIKTYSDYITKQYNQILKLNNNLQNQDPATIAKINLQTQLLEQNMTYADNVASLILTAIKTPA